MNLKQLTFWLLAIGAIALILGSVIGIITLDVEEFKNNVERGRVIGGDRDEGGCLVDAGYSWCEIKNRCLRTWEEPCE